MFNLSKEQLESKGAWITTSEIKQQPELWQEAFNYYVSNKERIDTFLNDIVKKHQRVRIIFTGAGTSAYVGDTILSYLKEVVDETIFDLQSVPTTHLVSNPKQYFKTTIPTILVSFARSGNSPESVAAVELGKQLVNDFYQMTITCAPNGKLAQQASGDITNLLLMMPSRSNDQGFAMTGSYTCMTLTALLVFDPTAILEKEKFVAAIVEMGHIALNYEETIQSLLETNFQRVVYLGSGALAGMARESQLKILELTAGKIATAFDSSLGFRHGPKSFVDEKTLVFTFVSNDGYTRLYDTDILVELSSDQIAHRVIGISVGAIDGNVQTSITFDEKYRFVPDGYLALPFVVIGQSVSLLSSVKVNNLPDTPSPTGTVNRVVKGVTIHPL